MSVYSALGVFWYDVRHGMQVKEFQGWANSKFESENPNHCFVSTCISRFADIIVQFYSQE